MELAGDQEEAVSILAGPGEAWACSRRENKKRRLFRLKLIEGNSTHAVRVLLLLVYHLPISVKHVE